MASIEELQKLISHRLDKLETIQQKQEIQKITNHFLEYYSHNFRKANVFSDDTESESTSTGAVTVYGGVGIAKNINVGGTATVEDSTDSSSSSTGSVIVKGGAGIAKNVNVGGVAKVEDETEASSTSTGSIVAAGGVGVASNVFAGGSIYQESFLLIPTGTIMMFAVGSAPDGWLQCDGSAVSRETYSRLFTVVATSYGVGDGSSTFTLPNFQGRLGLGFSEGYSIASTGGSETHTLTSDEIPAHTHTGTTDSDGAHTHTTGNTVQVTGHNTPGSIDSSSNGEIDINNPTTTTSSSSGSHTHTFTTDSTGTGGSHNIMQPYLVVNYIIKY